MVKKLYGIEWDNYTACACVEGFDGLEHDENEIISAWQHLINTGACWSLQGWYGRVASDLIAQGLCKKPKAKKEVANGC